MTARCCSCCVIGLRRQVTRDHHDGLIGSSFFLVFVFVPRKIFFCLAISPPTITPLYINSEEEKITLRKASRKFRTTHSTPQTNNEQNKKKRSRNIDSPPNTLFSTIPTPTPATNPMKSRLAFCFLLLSLVTFWITTTTVTSSSSSSSSPYELLDVEQLRSTGTFSVLIPDPFTMANGTTPPVDNSTSSSSCSQFILGVTDDAGASIIRFSVLQNDSDIGGSGGGSGSTVKAFNDSWKQRIFLRSVAGEQRIESITPITTTTITDSYEKRVYLLVVVKGARDIVEKQENGVVVAYTIKRRIIKFWLRDELEMIRMGHYDFEIDERRKPSVFQGIHLLTDPDHRNPFVHILYVLNGAFMCLFDVETMSRVTLYEPVSQFVFRKDTHYLVEDEINGPHSYLMFRTNEEVLNVFIIKKLRPYRAHQIELAYDVNSLNPLCMVHSKVQSSLIVSAVSEYTYGTIFQYDTTVRPGNDWPILTMKHYWRDSKTFFTHLGLSIDQTSAQLAYHGWSSWSISSYNLLNGSVDTASYIISQMGLPSVQTRLYPIDNNDRFLVMGQTRTKFNVIEYLSLESPSDGSAIIKKFSNLIDRVTCSFLHNSTDPLGPSLIAAMSYRYYESDRARVVLLNANYENKQLKPDSRREYVLRNGATSIEHCMKGNDTTVGYFVSMQSLRPLNAAIFHVLHLSLDDLSPLASFQLPLQSGIRFSFVSKRTLKLFVLTDGTTLTQFDLVTGSAVRECEIETEHALVKFLSFDSRFDTAALFSTATNDILTVDLESGKVLSTQAIGHPFECVIKRGPKLIVPLVSTTPNCTIMEIVSKHVKYIKTNETLSAGVGPCE